MFPHNLRHLFARTFYRVCRDVVRLGGLAEKEMDVAVLRGITGKLEEGELLELKRTFARRAEERYDLKPQLEDGQSRESGPREDGAFLI